MKDSEENAAGRRNFDVKEQVAGCCGMPVPAPLAKFEQVSGIGLTRFSPKVLIGSTLSA